jgi:hypothetical protein
MMADEVEVPVESKGGSRVLNTLSVILLSLTILVGIYYLVIFFFPETLLNPFAPIVIAEVVIPTATPNDQVVLPPTWTPTPTTLPSTPRPTFTAGPTVTPRSTRTPQPTETPTPTITPTPSPDLCSTLKLLGPPPGQRYLQYDNAELNWTFGRPLTAFEHFDILVGPPNGKGEATALLSVAWGDEAEPGNKNCTSYCTYTLALGEFRGGHTDWSVAVIRADKDRKVLGTICPAPPPYYFTR